MTVKLEGQSPTLVNAAKASGLPLSELDEAFGVVPVDRNHGLFAFQVNEGAISGKKEFKSEVKGPFSNPRIEPFK